MHGKNTSRHVDNAQNTATYAGQQENEVCLVQGGQRYKVPWVEMLRAAAI